MTGHAEAAMAPRGSRISVAGTALWTSEWGDPGLTPLVHWHGLGTRGGLHVAEVAGLLAAGHGLRVVAPDAPGFARSPEAPPIRPSELAALIPPLVDRLGVQRAPFMGWSWGGTVGCEVAARFPERVSALILLDGGYHDLDPEDRLSPDEVGRLWE